MEVVELHIKLYNLSTEYILCTYLPSKQNKKSKTNLNVENQLVYASKEKKEVGTVAYLPP